MIVNLRPTPPCRDSRIIDQAITLFIKSPEADSLRSVQLADQTPYKMWNINDEGLLSQVAFLESMPEPYNAPRQRLPSIYWQNGYIDVCKYETVTSKCSTTGSKIIPFLISEPSFDIDYPDQIDAASQQLLAANEAKTAHKRQLNYRHPS